jgi:transposase
MQAVTTIGLDIAKSVFQVHGIDAEGRMLICRKLKRRYVLAFFQKLPPCLVGIIDTTTADEAATKIREIALIGALATGMPHIHLPQHS